jgi:ankyrin repeat protein
MNISQELIKSCEVNDIAKARDLLSQGASTEICNDEGSFPIHIVAAMGYKAMAELIIQYGADSNALNKYGLPAITIASFNGHLELVKTFINANADLHVGKDGFTSMHAAAGSGHSNIVQLLASAGLSVNNKDKSGRIPLHWAAQEGKYEVACLLINLGAQIDIGDQFGTTPLHIAASEGHIDLVNLFVKTTSNIDQMAELDGSALHSACAWGRIEIAKILISNGADRYLIDHDGNKPEDLAEMYGHSEIVKFLRSGY